MPKNTSIESIFIIGSGPIQIGQGCEFDYSGTQACRALREEGYRIILLNSNPATIMTDPETADRVYIEPITLESAENIIQTERPDAILATMGGQVALNLLMELNQAGILKKYQLSCIGVHPESIRLAEDRDSFKKLVEELNYETTKGQFVKTVQEALEWQENEAISFPIIVRSSYTLGGSGGGIATTETEFKELVQTALGISPIHEVLVEESILGWKEYELEVMRDCKDNFVVICAVENINPVGVHTGDSITIAPCMTLRDKEYQNLRNISKALVKAVGMETGGANIQFAVHPESGRVIVIEMNPRVSRSSALVSKATGYPIAFISAKLAVGYSLDELKNQITGTTTAAFEPVIDYVAIKIPRWNFDKFPEADRRLGIQMKSVGEVLAFGSSFSDAFQKAWRSLDISVDGWEPISCPKTELSKRLKERDADIFRLIKNAFDSGFCIDEIFKLCGINRWFLHELFKLQQLEIELKEKKLSSSLLRKAKQNGFSNQQIARLKNVDIEELESSLSDFAIQPVFKRVDSCAAEFDAQSPYYFKSYDDYDDNQISPKKKIIIIGSGPNRIGQGIEFDYACVHAVKAVQNLGYESILINCNPETVSTDFNLSNKLYIEALYEEDILDILRVEQADGILLQFGGQSPIKLAKAIHQNGFPIIGSDLQAIDRCEDRKKFKALAETLNFCIPKAETLSNLNDLENKVARLSFPILLRPSYVIGGTGMELIQSKKDLKKRISKLQFSDEKPLLLDEFLEDAVEYDMDILSDADKIQLIGIMEHIEEAGVHSGDSHCIFPPQNLSKEIEAEMLSIAKKISQELRCFGLLNIQFALNKYNKLFVIEVNPRCSRTVPFIAKAMQFPYIQVATKLCLAKRLSDFTFPKLNKVEQIFVKAAVFPFHKFDRFNPLLNANMKSLGEVMGVASSLKEALKEAIISAGIDIKKDALFIDKKSDTEKVIELRKNKRNITSSKRMWELIRDWS